MIEKIDETPFNELPQALVEDMLSQCNDLSKKLINSFQKLSDIKKNIRKELKQTDLFKKDSEITSAPVHPTSCGVDGSYTIEKLLSTDIVASAGVAIEGLTPPTEERHWPIPHHDSNILTISHSDSTSVVSRAIMMCMELTLAANAPHNVVFLDGSLTTPFIYFNQALNQLFNVADDLSDELNERLILALDSYKKILISEKSDQIFSGVPKYTTKKEICQRILNLKEYEDRGLLSFILKAGEFIGPMKIQKPESPWHIGKPTSISRNKFDEIISALNNLYIIYYRPYEYFPALRLEISPSIANNQYRLSILLESIRLQCGSPGIMEPYPLYMADRMVKHLRTALPAIRKTTTQEMTLKWEGSVGDIYFAMHGYRTEWGK